MSSEQQQAIEPEIVHPESEHPKKKSKALAKREEPGAIATGPAPGSIEDLMVRAIDKGDMDLIERVFALREKVKAEQSRQAFFDAKAKFQAAVPKIPKTKKGYGYWYAPLGVIDATIKKAMEQAGLSKKWTQVESDGMVTMTCIISHLEGHCEENSIGPVPWDLLERTQQMNALQHRAATITYLQRYTLIGALGLSTADDDPDGVIPEDARAQKAQQRAPVSQPQPRPTAQKKAAAAKSANGERVHLQPAAAGEEVEAPTIKVLTSKMELAALSNGDFKKRFGLNGLEQVKRTDLQSVLGWIIDPQNA